MSTNTALLIIDVQKALVDGEKPVHHLPELLANINTLIAQARSTDTPIIYIQDNDVDEIGSPGWQIHEAIAPEKGDLVIRKPETDAFYRTSLQEDLAARDIKHLVISGCKTEHCVDATCRRATNLGYNVTLVEDAHSTTDNEILAAEQIITYHNYLLDGLWSDEHGEVVGVYVKKTSEIAL